MDYDEPLSFTRIMRAASSPRGTMLRLIEDKQKELESLQRKLSRLEHLPETDPCDENGDVLFFKRRFNNSPRVYSYAAIKVGGKYFLTGKTISGQYWSELLAWLTKDGGEVLEMRKMKKGKNLLDIDA